MKQPRSERGFIALISALVISAILVALVFSVGTSTLFARFDALGGENKRISLGLAESCINVALMALATSTSPSTYSPTNQLVTVGTDSQGNPMNCTIQSISHSGSVATIDAQAQWLGAYSNVTARATIPDPNVGSLVPPPTCALSASPTTVPQGQNVLLQWGTANASSFSLDHGVGSQAAVASGSYSVVSSGVGSVTYIGTATGPGGATQCSATFTVSPPPPSPACADTVMMLDRTGSLTSTDRNNIKSAANQLITLYAGVSSLPKIGAGSFGALDNQHYASVPAPQGWLQSTYSSLQSTVGTMVDNTSSCTDIPSGQSCGTNIAAAVTSGYQELGSVRHTTGYQKVLILVSDGQTNRPFNDAGHANDRNAALSASDSAKVNSVAVFTVLYSQLGTQTQTDRTLMAQLASGAVAVPGHFPGSDDSSVVTGATGFLYPTALHTPNSWTNATNVFANDASFATDSTANNAQGFANFHFTVPSGAAISGIEGYIDGLSGPGAVNGGNLAPNAISSYDGWSQTGGTSKYNAVSTNNADTSYISASAQNLAQTFVFPNAAIPAGATINSVTISAVARASTAGAQIALRSEKGTGAGSQSDGSPIALSGSYATYTRTMTTNPFTSAAWSLSEVNAWTTRFGVIKTNTSGTARVTQIFLTVNYTPASAGSCQVGVALSWNNGGSWTASKSVTLGTTQSSINFGSSADTWGRAWTSGEFSDANFILRLTNTNCAGGTAASVNYVTAKAYYSASDANAENSDGDNFFITPDTSNPSSIQNIFDTIGKKVCPAAAAQCANTVDDDSDGFADAADAQCHTDGNASNAASYNASINDEYSHPAPPPPPSAPPPPPSVDLGSWEEVPH